MGKTADVGIISPDDQENEEHFVVQISDLQFAWSTGDESILDIEQFRIQRGEHLFLIGPSGSGKSTLLGLLAGIQVPQNGAVQVCGQRLDGMSGAARDRFRADHMGYIFQMFNLIPYLGLVENVLLPCRFSSLRRRNVLEKAESLEAEALRLLGKLKLDDNKLLKKPVVELSVGQQQRVAAARALIGSPELVIADEPTSSLDTDHRQNFLELLFRECSKVGSTLVFVSHDVSLGQHFHRTIHLNELNRVAARKAGE